MPSCRHIGRGPINLLLNVFPRPRPFIHPTTVRVLHTFTGWLLIAADDVITSITNYRIGCPPVGCRVPLYNALLYLRIAVPIFDEHTVFAQDADRNFFVLAFLYRHLTRAVARCEVRRGGLSLMTLSFPTLHRLRDVRN